MSRTAVEASARLRRARADAKAALRRAQTKAEALELLARTVEDPPEAIKGMHVAQLLLAAPRVGAGTLDRVTCETRTPCFRRVGRLTVRQRVALAEGLRDAKPKPPAPRKPKVVPIREEPGAPWETANRADGPAVVAWIESSGVPARIAALPDALERQAYARRISEWRRGGHATVWTLDRMLVRVGVHLSQLPDECWLTNEERIAA